jgi:hypothetical protein
MGGGGHPHDPPAALLRAVAQGWTGLVAVDGRGTDGEDPVTLLHVGPPPGGGAARLAVEGLPGRCGRPRFVRMWLEHDPPAPGRGGGCRTDLAHAAGRRRMRALAAHGAVTVWTARPCDRASVRRLRVPLADGARRALRDVAARAGECFTADPPPFGLTGPCWRRLAERAPCLAEAGDDDPEVLVVIPADGLGRSSAPAGAVSFDVRRRDGRVILATRLWRPDRDTVVEIDIADVAQRDLALTLSAQAHVHVVAVERGTGRITESLRASLRGGPAG